MKREAAVDSMTWAVAGSGQVKKGGGKKKLHQVTQNLQELKILFHGTMSEGRKRRKTFMELTMHATIYACTVQQKKGDSVLLLPPGILGILCTFSSRHVYIFL